MEFILYIIIGMAAGGAIGLLAARGKNGALEAKTEALSKDMERMADECARKEQELAAQGEACKRLEAENQALTVKNCVMETQRSSDAEAHRKELEGMRRLTEEQETRHKEAMEAMKVTFGDTINHLKAELKAATEGLLKERQKEFADYNKENMQGIVEPLNETIKKMREAMDGYSKEQSVFSGTMKTNIETIIKQTETAQKSAEELTTALKHDTKVQGDYGEAILDEILSKQGFTEGIHYELQYVMKDDKTGKALKDDEGTGLRPDVVFHLDTVRDVIIDSKMNLTDFINYANADNEEDRKRFMERHVKCIENQVKLLSQKNYFKHHKKTARRMDYVIMFVPISAAWWEAMRWKPSLWRKAMESNVYIADEQTLFAALRIIKLTWTQIAQVNSQKEIFDLVNEMINRIGQFMKQFKAVGEKLEKAQEAYASCSDKLANGQQSVLKTTAKLMDKGGQENKKNPVKPFLDVDDIEELPVPHPVSPTGEEDRDSRCAQQANAELAGA